MRKSFILFTILIATLVFAVMTDSSENSNYEKSLIVDSEDGSDLLASEIVSQDQ
ncbi:hypothetical protein [Costertonia aggregata]|uniref:Uncharacterized protein n=1 Tax=Costertonia aggregata TaxID=343403 RepID=A0A7H9ANY7_9FLAO|nr:hypothetical protein [Costertonia aggregata]QLG45150.1 hypothetical protein HYG79_07225 [Costertonia aggregata]